MTNHDLIQKLKQLIHDWEEVRGPRNWPEQDLVEDAARQDCADELKEILKEEPDNA